MLLATRRYAHRALPLASCPQPLARFSGLGAGSGRGGGEALLTGEPEDAALSRAILRWRDRLGEVPNMARLAACQDGGMRLVMPGDGEWPTQLDDLGDTRPLVLWLRGTADLRLTCVNSVAIVGSRAATGYADER